MGGVPAVMKLLLEEGLIHGDCLTVTGKTVAENLAELPGLTPGQDIICPLAHPLKATGHLQILYGNLSTEVQWPRLRARGHPVFRAGQGL